MEFNFRSQGLQLSPIKKMELLASKIPGVISLAQGIPSFETPEIVKERVIEAILENKTSKYSLAPGLSQLREIVEEKLAQDKMFYDYEKEIIITCGAIEAIAATLLTILEVGDEVIIPSPTYTTYQEVLKLAGGRPIFLNLDEENFWSFDLEKFKKLINPKTKAILFCNPNNPTGTIYAKDQLLGVGELAEKHNLFVISDEVYKDFIYRENYSFFSLAQIPELRERIIRIFSFSKAYAMTGWRIGFLHTDKKLAQEILKVHDCLVTCAPVVSQYAAIAAFEKADNFIKTNFNSYLIRRDLICQRLDRLNKIFSYYKPESAYFVFPKINETDSWQFALKLLEQAKVAVVPGVAFGPNGEGHIRLAFGVSSEIINEAFDRLEKYFSTKK
jgi:aminotransferase